MPDLDFNFYAGGIEDGILEVLKTPMQAVGGRGFATYSGELDDPDALKNAIAQQTVLFPLTMVSYAGGKSIKEPATSPVLGRPLHYLHDCDFAVIVADDNSQGERNRRRGRVYEMISVVWNELTGRRLKKQVEDEQFLLNTQVFEPTDVIQIRMPNITAYGVVISTAFKWSSPDRTEDGIPVSEIIVGVNSLTDPAAYPGNLPGVTFITE